MKTIPSAVRTILKEDETAREAARRGILNNSAYAREILNRVENETWKDVEESSISVAINRVTQDTSFQPVKPKLVFDRISVETGLVDVTYENTLQVIEALNNTIPKLRATFAQDLYLETNGQRQITMVMTKSMWDEVIKIVTIKPIGLYSNQVALTIAFDDRYLKIPNFIYAVIGLFAIEYINIIEIFSTMTEIVVVMSESDLDTALRQVKKLLQ
ncbi:MAG: hypothetical protein GW947_00940 [Candidatus Pacebacteria bacterium]|nr:hypothetical protein [Candidatus Paceibacterota bacterium]PIR60116.1 MAG: hypothetical protein COU68_03065 [Candidatus Pacebacteria bacterium CG10_big_fil_rev_8_21_14_0_10_45_6]